MPLKLVMIGLGNQGREHLAAVRQLELQGELEFVAICDPAAATADMARELGVAHYSEYRTLLKNTSPDLAVICVPNHLHTEVTTTCLEHDVHVLKEKPLALTLEQAVELLELACKRRRVLKIAQQRFHHPHYLKARSWLHRIGPPMFLNYEFTLNDTRNSWYWDETCGGGSWYGLGWHACSVMSWFLGLPKQVSLKTINSSRRAWSYRTDDLAMLNVDFEGGGVGRILTSVVYATKSENLMIHGRLGSIEVNRERAVLYNADGTVVERDVDAVEKGLLYLEQLREFVTLARSGDEVGGYFDADAYSTMLLLHAGIESGRQGGAAMSPTMFDGLSRMNNSVSTGT